MEFFNPNPDVAPAVLATDLDGTFLPFPGDASHADALDAFRQARAARRLGLVFATGRHLESVLDAMREHALPAPDWIVCDVGTSIHRRVGHDYERHAPFEELLAAQTEGATRADVEALLSDVAGLVPQSPERQRRFKASYVSDAKDAEALAALANRRLAAARLPFSCLASLDPFHGKGLLDVLPVGASKAAALVWLAAHADFAPDEVVFAGDSGNDLPALACGFRAILVANASPELARRAESELAARGLSGRLFRAARTATAGVLEGCRHFGLLP